MVTLYPHELRMKNTAKQYHVCVCGGGGGGGGGGGDKIKNNNLC